MTSFGRIALFGALFGGTSASASFFALDADPFLGKVVASRSCVHSGIEAALRNASLQSLDEDDNLESGLSNVMERLHPFYSVLPKNQYDRLSSAGVRYLLSRYFLRQHAWSVHRLAPSGSWSDPFPMETLAAWAPAGLQKVVADHLNGRGLQLREVAVLATLLENRVHVEAVDTLRVLWRLHGLLPDDRIDPALMETIVEEHAWFQLAEMNVSELETLSLGQLEEMRAGTLMSLSWPSTKQLLLKIQKRVTRNKDDKLTFEVGEQIVVRFIGQFGALQNEECLALKRDLVEMESSRPGRVDLRRFHASAVSGQGLLGFVETAGYLRRLGALDESVKKSQTVIIPNYMNSPANYIASGRHFTVVCKDECEDLLGHIERRVGGPEATANEIMAIVTSLPPREGVVMLGDTVVNHLQELAGIHGGWVPLHGRLFALWLHHVYPRDCPYPALAGTASLITWEKFESETHLPSAATPQELARDAAEVAAGALLSESVPSELPWDLQEDVLGDEVLSALPWDLQEALLGGRAVHHVHFKDAWPVILAGTVAVLLLISIISAVRSHARVEVVDPSRFLDADAKVEDAAPETCETLS